MSRESSLNHLYKSEIKHFYKSIMELIGDLSHYEADTDIGTTIHRCGKNYQVRFEVTKLVDVKDVFKSIRLQVLYFLLLLETEGSLFREICFNKIKDGFIASELTREEIDTCLKRFITSIQILYNDTMIEAIITFRKGTGVYSFTLFFDSNIPFYFNKYMITE